MNNPSTFFSAYGPFAGIMNGAQGVFPGEDLHNAGIPFDTNVRLSRSIGGRRYNKFELAQNFATIERALNNLRNANLKKFAQIKKTYFKGSNGTGIITQDQTTVQPSADLTNVTYNRIPRIDEDGKYTMPNSSAAQSTLGKVKSEDGTIWYTVAKDSGQIHFAVSSTIEVWLDATGWHVSAPGTSSAAVNGFSIEFDSGKSLWKFYKDTTLLGVINGNVQTDNFRKTAPGDDATAATTEAYIAFDETNNRIGFFCQTEDESAVKGTGYIDSTGYHDGAA